VGFVLAEPVEDGAVRVGHGGAELGDFGGDQLDDAEDRNAGCCFGDGEPGCGHRFSF
jgi:hypothetical protein